MMMLFSQLKVQNLYVVSYMLVDMCAWMVDVPD